MAVTPGLKPTKKCSAQQNEQDISQRNYHLRGRCDSRIPREDETEDEM